ncbi:unnamed protein product [Prunus armeniaca]
MATQPSLKITLNVESGVHLHSGTAILGGTTAHANLAATAKYGPVLDQMHQFPHLPLRLTFAVLEHTSNDGQTHRQTTREVPRKSSKNEHARRRTRTCRPACGHVTSIHK